jgi:hypothetical protein
MINVYQINFTDQQVDQINDPSTPEPDYYKAYLKTTFRADTCGEGDLFVAGVHEAWHMGLYQHVADVSTDCLDTAFAVMNRWNAVDEKLVRRHRPLHSMSVGDIVVNNGSAYAVAQFGFNPLNLEGVANG